jgi:hypothetical protein
MDQSNNDTSLSVCTIHISVQHGNRATSVASVATDHISNQHGTERRQLPACTTPHGSTFMTKSVTIFISHWRWVVTWRKMCSSRKRSSSLMNTVHQMWLSFYDDFRIIVNSSQKVFNDKYGLFRDESVLSLMWTSVLVPMHSIKSRLGVAWDMGLV